MAGIKPFGTEARKEFKDLKFEEIVEICLEKGKEEWLEEAMKRPMPRKKWQKTTVVDENGKKKRVVDKTKPQIDYLGKPTFIELKEMFLVEIIGIEPAKKEETEKKLSMAEMFALKKAEFAAKQEGK